MPAVALDGVGALNEDDSVEEGLDGAAAASIQTTRSPSWIGFLPPSMLVPWARTAKAASPGSRGRSSSTVRTSSGAAAGSVLPAAALRVG